MRKIYTQKMEKCRFKLNENFVKKLLVRYQTAYTLRLMSMDNFMEWDLKN